MVRNSHSSKTDEDMELSVEEFDAEMEEEDVRPALDIAPRDRKLVTHPYDFIIRSLADQIEDKSLILADKFQRRRVWDDTKASRLIESLLLNVPIPVCYFAELEDGSYSVIDGQQRLTAIYRFLKNDFALRGLRVRPELNRKRYNQLDTVDKRVIASRTIRCIVILKESHADIRFDVFERLNTSSVRLNAQELRNSMYRGRLNDLLQKLSEYEKFMKARGVSTIDKRMQDNELILRFFAFHFRPHEYKGYLAPFLDSYLKDSVRFSQSELAEHGEIFRKSVDDVYSVFGSQSFRRYTEGQTWEKLVNRALYDVQMLSFARIDSDVIRRKKKEIVGALKDVCQDPEFGQAITSGTQAIRAVHSRIDKWRESLLKIEIEVPYTKVGQESRG